MANKNPPPAKPASMADASLRDMDREIDSLVAKGVEAAAKGENIEQVLEVMLSTLPGSMRDKARKKFAALLKKRGMREPQGEADVPSRTTLARLRNIFTVSTQQAIERIRLLVSTHPEIAQRIEKAGKILMNSGVRADKIRLAEADLGSMAPIIMGAATEQKNNTRGV